MAGPAIAVDIRRAGERAATTTEWLDSKHSFSFGGYYAPENTHHGVLLVNNDDRVAPGRGFDFHPHRDMEIVTWVLRGSLVHQDSTGTSGIVYPGLVQRMSAGSGVLHSERNDSWTLTGLPEHREPVRFVQMWVVPHESGGTPGYAQCEVDDALRGGALVPVASGRAAHRGSAAIAIGNRGAALHCARLRIGQQVSLPEAPYLHLFVAVGNVEVEGVGPLAAGDAVRYTASGGHRVTAAGPAEILVWEMHADLVAA